MDDLILGEGEIHKRRVAGGARITIDGSQGHMFLEVRAGEWLALASLNPEDVKWLAKVVNSKVAQAPTE